MEVTYNTVTLHIHDGMHQQCWMLEVSSNMLPMATQGHSHNMIKCTIFHLKSVSLNFPQPDLVAHSGRDNRILHRIHKHTHKHIRTHTCTYTNILVCEYAVVTVSMLYSCLD